MPHRYTLYTTCIQSRNCFKRDLCIETLYFNLCDSGPNSNKLYLLYIQYIIIIVSWFYMVDNVSLTGADHQIKHDPIVLIY